MTTSDKVKGVRVIGQNLQYLFGLYLLFVLLSYFGSFLMLGTAAQGIGNNSAFTIQLDDYGILLLFWTSLIILPTIALTWKYKTDPLVQAAKLKIFIKCRFLLWIFMGIMFVFPYPFLLVTEHRIALQYIPALEVLGAGLAYAFYTTIAIFGSAVLVYIFSPGIIKRLTIIPNLEVFTILKHIVDTPKLTLPAYSFLLDEAYSILTQAMARGFPNFVLTGLGEMFVDIQIGVKMGSAEEKQAIVGFFEKVENIKSRGKNIGGRASILLVDINSLRNALETSDKVRSTSKIIGSYDRNIVQLKWLAGIIALTIIGVIGYALISGAIPQSSLLPGLIITVFGLAVGLLVWALNLAKLRQE